MKKLFLIFATLFTLYSCNNQAPKESSNTTTKENTQSQGMNNEDFDKLLSQYKDYMNKNTELMQKAAKGDMSATAEYTTVMQKATEVAESFEKLKKEGKLTQEQEVKLMKTMAEVSAPLMQVGK